MPEETTPKGKSSGKRIVALGILLIFCLIMTGAAAIVLSYYHYLQTPILTTTVETPFAIAKGESFDSVLTRLHRDGIVSSPFYFKIAGRLQGTRGKMKAGDYLIPAGTTPQALLELLTKGAERYVKVTIPEGFTIYDVGNVLFDALGTDPSEFLALAKDPNLIAELGLPSGIGSLEGFLFPDTYQVAKSQPLRALIVQMVENFRKHYDAIVAAASTPPELSMLQITTFASVIEKETGTAAERPRIASVFYNRMRQGMRLQSDPTVIYGIGPTFNGNLTKKDLQTPSPYNTYTQKGLPVGPICNPGAAAIKAVFSPEQSDFFYFVADKSGGHLFTRTLDEHNRAVRQYQLRR